MHFYYFEWRFHIQKSQQYKGPYFQNKYMFIWFKRLIYSCMGYRLLPTYRCLTSLLNSTSDGHQPFLASGGGAVYSLQSPSVHLILPTSSASSFVDRHHLLYHHHHVYHHRHVYHRHHDNHCHHHVYHHHVYHHHPVHHHHHHPSSRHSF